MVTVANGERIEGVGFNFTMVFCCYGPGLIGLKSAMFYQRIEVDVWVELELFGVGLKVFGELMVRWVVRVMGGQWEILVLA